MKQKLVTLSAFKCHLEDPLESEMCFLSSLAECWMFREENKYESQGGLRHNKANAWLQVKFSSPVEFYLQEVLSIMSSWLPKSKHEFCNPKKICLV